MTRGTRSRVSSALGPAVVLASLLAVSCASTARSTQPAFGPFAAHRELADEVGLSPCAAADLDCRAFTASLAWRPDERRPLLSARGLRRLATLQKLPLGERERALRCLAFVAWAEARSDGVHGMHAVVAVVLNRTKDPAFPHHPCAVVAAAHAFEPVSAVGHKRVADAIRAGAFTPFPRPTNPVELLALKVARLLVWNLATSGSLHDPTEGATHFVAPAVLRQRGDPLPSWVTAFRRTVRIGGHLFYRKPLALAAQG